MADVAVLDIILRTGKAKTQLASISTGLVGVGTAATGAATKTVAATTAMTGGFAKLRAALFSTQALLLTLGVGIGLSATINTLKDFEFTMAGVRAVTGATAEEFVLLEDKARSLGATTIFAASEAAEGLRLLGLAGFTVEEALGGIDGTLALATAGTLDLGSASRITANIIRSFRLEASEAANVADVLAVTATNANTTVFGLGNAFSFVGAVANAANQSVADTAAAIGVLADAGFDAGRAGTGLRRVLGEILSKSDKLAGRLPDLGLTMEDISFETNSMAEVFGNLAPLASDAAFALEVFGQRGGPAFLALTGQADRIADLAEKTRDAGGAAQEIADILTDTLQGSIKLFRSALEEAILTLSGTREGMKAVFDAARNLVSALTGNTQAIAGNVEKWLDLAESVKAATVAVVTFGSFALLRTLVPALNKAGAAAARAALAFALTPIGAAILAISAMTGLLFLMRDRMIEVGGTTARVGSIVSATFAAIKKGVGFAVDGVLLLVNGFFDLVGAVTGVDIQFAKLAKEFTGGLLDKATRFVDTVLNGFGLIGAVAGIVAVQLPKQFKAALADLKDQFAALGDAFVELVTGNTEEAGRLLGEALANGVRKSAVEDETRRLLVDAVSEEGTKSRFADALQDLWDDAVTRTEIDLDPKLDPNFVKKLNEFQVTLAGIEKQVPALELTLEKFSKEDFTKEQREKFLLLGDTTGDVVQRVRNLNEEIKRLGGFDALGPEDLERLAPELALIKRLTNEGASGWADFADEVTKAKESSADASEVIAKLREEQRILNATTEEGAETLRILAEAKLLDADASNEQKQVILGLIPQVQRLRREQEQLFAIQAKDPFVQFSENANTLAANLEKGRISQEQFNLELGEMRLKLDKAARANEDLNFEIDQLDRAPFAQGLAEGARNLGFTEEAVKGLGEDFASLGDGITEALFSGEDAGAALLSSLDQIGQRIAKLALEQFLLKPLFDFISGGGTGRSGEGGLLGAFGGGGGGGNGGGGGGTASGIGSLLGTVAGFFAEGGISQSPGSFGVVPKGMFKNARRFQFGGTTDTIPALLSRNEAVVPLPGGRGIPVQFPEGGEGPGGGTTVVNVNISGVTDMVSFQRSRGQIEAQLRGAVERGARNT